MLQQSFLGKSRSPHRGCLQQGPISAALPVGRLLAVDAKDGSTPAADVLRNLQLALPVRHDTWQRGRHQVARDLGPRVGALFALKFLEVHAVTYQVRQQLPVGSVLEKDTGLTSLTTPQRYAAVLYSGTPSRTHEAALHRGYHTHGSCDKYVWKRVLACLPKDPSDSCGGVDA